MKYTVIGIRELIENQQSHEHGSCEMVQYEVIMKDEQGILCSFFANNTYGDCSSGYTSASWGSFSEVKPISNIGTLHYVPKPNTTLVGEFSFNDDYGNLNDVATGKALVWHNSDGGDNYYPSGIAEIDTSVFVPTPRKVDRRKLYLFQGPSGVGKSFLAANSTLEVYETDSSEELPKNLSDYSIVVIGNKHAFTADQFKNVLKDAPVDVVIVTFNGRG